MPDRVKEKLVELIVQGNIMAFKRSESFAEIIADHLIANGVTVQDEAKLYWKPVDEHISNLTCSACDSHLGCREDAKFCPECGAKFVINEAQPPKGDDT